MNVNIAVAVDVGALKARAGDIMEDGYAILRVITVVATGLMNDVIVMSNRITPVLYMYALKYSLR